MKIIIHLIVFIFIFSESFTQKIPDSLLVMLNDDNIADTTLINLYLKIAKGKKNDLDSALYYSKLGLKKSNEIGYAKGSIESYKSIAVVYYRKDKLIESVKNLTRALNISLNTGDKPNAVQCYGNIGEIYYQQGYYSKALEYYLKSLVIAEEIGQKRTYSYLYTNIGQIYLQQKKHKEALEYIQKNIDLAEQPGEKINLDKSYASIGKIYHEIGKIDLALEFYSKSLELYKEFDNKIGSVYAYQSIGDLFYEKKVFDKALGFYQQAKEISELVNSKFEIASSYALLGKYYFKTKKIDSASFYLMKSIEMAKEIGAIVTIKEASETLTQLYKKTNDYEKAFEAHVLYKEMSDSIDNQETDKRLAQLQMQHEFEKQSKENEAVQQAREESFQEDLRKRKLISYYLIGGIIIMIILLFLAVMNYRAYRKANDKLNMQKAAIQSKNEELQQIQEEILSQRDEIEIQRNDYAKLNATKDKFFSIIAHDLKNPFNTFINISDLLISNYKELPEEDMLEMFHLINTASKNTFALLENLLSWARTQTGKIKALRQKIDINKIANRNIQLLKLSAENKNIEISSDIPVNTYAFIDENMINTVIRNLVSNAIKFTKPGGKITLSVEDLGDKIEVQVSDTGIGIRDEVLPKLFKLDEFHTTPGTMKELGSGLGTIICKEFIEKNDGHISVESEVGVGTTFKFTLPKPRK